VSVWSELLPAGSLGGAAILLVQAGTKWLRARSLAARVRKEASDQPVYGTAGWVWKELLRERGARHALRDRLDSEVVRLRERVSHLEGRTASGEQERIDFDRTENDTDPVPAPPMRDSPSVRTDTARRARRSRP
jgi:hypothetical protein